MRYLLLISIWSGLALGNPPQRPFCRDADYQKTYQAPLRFLAVRPLDSFMDGFVLARHQTNPYRVPTSAAMVGIHPVPGVSTQFIKDALGRLVWEYHQGRHKISPLLATRLETSIHKAFDAQDFRSIFYQIHTPHPPESPERVAAALRLYDASTQGPSTQRIAPLEEWLSWTFPERQKKGVALVELQFAFNNYSLDLTELHAFQHLLREAATYLDLFYVSRQVPVVIRLITTLGRAKLFQNPKHYGFEVDEGAPTRDSDLVVLRISGQEFVARFGSRWPIWKNIYELSPPPENPLFSPGPFHEALYRRLAREARRYQCSQILSEEFPTFSSYLDGLFVPVMDSTEASLLF